MYIVKWFYGKNNRCKYYYKEFNSFIKAIKFYLYHINRNKRTLFFFNIFDRI